MKRWRVGDPGKQGAPHSVIERLRSLVGHVVVAASYSGTEKLGGDVVGRGAAMIKVPCAHPAHILVVDDHQDSAETLVRLLRLCGFDAEAASNGEQAIESARRCWPEIALLDLGLPAMDGYEVAIRLRQEAGCRQIVLIAVTGYGQLEDRQRCRAVGIDHHLLKPVNPEVLLALLSGSGAALGAEGASSEPRPVTCSPPLADSPPPPLVPPNRT